MKFIVKEQHGFCKGKSTVSNLLLFTNYIYTAFADCSQVDTVYLDFSKAFDTINHARLLQKIRSFGVQGRLLRWLESYLSGRTQCVRVRNGLSPSITIPSGVPQGSHIGPLLFILFINDLPSYLNFSKCIIYADDVKLFSRVSTPMDSSKLQRDLDSLVRWSTENGLPFNVSKCKVMHFRRARTCTEFNYTINGSILEKVDETKDLGVIMDYRLSFEPQESAVIVKAMRLVGFIRRTTVDFLSPHTLLHLYKSLVIPIITYCSPVWSPYTQDSFIRLEAIQHKILRYMSCKTSRPMSTTSNH